VTTCAAAEPDPTDDDLEKISVSAPILSAPNQWLQVYGPAVAKRLNDALPGANLDAVDVNNLMSLCGFDSVYNDGDAGPWCGVFTAEEWQANEYYYDLQVSSSVFPT
jgi:hypothetical protein